MQKLDGVEDLRVRRTRKLLQQALIEGTVEKGHCTYTLPKVFYEVADMLKEESESLKLPPQDFLVYCR